MNTRESKLNVSNLMIDTVKKDIKNMHLGVYPPQGRIRVAAPLAASDEAIRYFVVSRLPWIKKQQQRFLRQERESRREYVSGESHYFLGRRYRLNVTYVEGPPSVEIWRAAYIDLHVTPEMTVQQRRVLVETFYRAELKKLIPGMVTTWENKLGIHVGEIRIKKMKTKWGSCNPNHRRIWLNLELAKVSSRCINYAFVHELVHIVEKRHSDRFLRLLRSALPSYERDREELNSGVLGHFKWKCST